MGNINGGQAVLMMEFKDLILFFMLVKEEKKYNIQMHLVSFAI